MFIYQRVCLVRVGRTSTLRIVQSMAQFIGPIQMLTPDVPAIPNMTGDIPMFSWQKDVQTYIQTTYQTNYLLLC